MSPTCPRRRDPVQLIATSTSHKKSGGGEETLFNEHLLGFPSCVVYEVQDQK